MKKIWLWILSVLAAVGTVLAFIFRAEPKPNPYIEKELDEAEETITEIKGRQTDRKKRAKELEKWRNRLPMLFLLLVLCFPSGAQAAEIPSDYDTLLKYYQEMSQIAAEYKTLYEEAEADVNALVKQNEHLRKLVESQQEIINSLLEKKISVSAGVTLDKDGPGLIALASYQF